MASKSETWYDRQANISKMITYAALLVLLGSIGWAAYSAYEAYTLSNDAKISLDVATAHPDYHLAMFSAIGGVVAAAFLVGVSAVIDLLIVNAEALRSR